MTAAPETLWTQLIAGLRRAGRLPLGYEGMTPAELARRIVASDGDRIIGRLVWEWYYPRRYGDRTGGMSDAEAEAFVAGLTRTIGRVDDEPPESAAESSTSVESCRLCGAELPASDGEGV
jgi:hypothetical protein